MKKTPANILRLLFVLFLLTAISLAYILYQSTLIDWWIPACFGAILPVVTVSFYKKWTWLTHSFNRFVNLICHLLCLECLGYTLFITANFYFRDTKNPEMVTMPIIDKHSEMKEYRHRVGKRRYRTNNRQEFHIKIDLGNGKTKDLIVPSSFYRKVKDNTLDLTLEKGLLGYPIITDF